jgi:hypothetical protein
MFTTRPVRSDGFLQQSHADSAGDSADDLTTDGLRVENPAIIDG